MGINEYLKGTKAELGHVKWPTRRQASLFTALVVIISIAIAYFLGVFDFIFSQALEGIIF